MGIALCKNGKHLVCGDSFDKYGRCIQCRRDADRRRYAADPEKFRAERKKNYNKEYSCAYSKKHRKAFPEMEAARKKRYATSDKGKEVMRAASKRWRDKNPDKVKAQARRRLEDLSDAYVRRYCFGMPSVEIPQEVIELKRQHLLLKREIKQWQQSQK